VSIIPYLKRCIFTDVSAENNSTCPHGLFSCRSRRLLIRQQLQSTEMQQQRWALYTMRS